MATEQDWAAYANQSVLNDTDTLLARTAAGAGVEVPGSAFIKKDGSGNSNLAIGVPTAAGGLRYWDIYNQENTSPSSGAIVRLITYNAAGSGLFGANLVKYRNGLFQISNDESSGIGAIAFAIAGVQRVVMQGDGHLRPGADNNAACGVGSYRWSAIYAATGTINTSDEREKVWRGAASDAELRAARRIASELGFYQWKDAVDAKGADGARYHFGVRAQRVWSIMADEGLIDLIGEDGRPGATPYAFLCFDEWGDEFADEMGIAEVEQEIDGETVIINERVPTGRQVLVRPAGNRFGIRVDQLTLFLIAAQEQRLAALEAAA